MTNTAHALAVSSRLEPPRVARAPVRILRIATVLDRTGLRRSNLYVMIRAGRFPASLPLGPRCVGWIEAEVEAWIAARAAARDSASKTSSLGVFS